MNISKCVKLNAELLDKMKIEKLKHVQIFFKIYKDEPCFMFASLDTSKRKEKIKHICDDYKLKLIKETKTTLIYKI